MAFQDVREYISALEKHGELQCIKAEVDWDIEAGAIMRKCCEIGAPAPFFEKIQGYPQGFNRLAGGLLAGSRKGSLCRCAIAMGMDPGASTGEVIEECLRRMNNPIKPIIVKTGPCKENILKGDEVDLFKFPSAMIHKGDGGRYIGSWHIVVSKDLDSEWVNWGMYRSHIVTPRKATLQIEAWRHWGVMFYQGYEPRNITMPVSLAIGPDPISAMSAATDVPPYVSEVDIAGGLRKEPVSLVKCETNDLYVPATSEVVIEGRVVPNERIEEGPHGEYTGYRVSERGTHERLLFRVDAITFRNNPILTFSCMGMPVDDSHTIFSLTRSAMLTEDLRRRKIPIRGVYVPPWAPAAVIVSLRKPYAQIVHEVAAAIWAHPVGREVHYVIAIEETADPYDAQSVVHEIAFKCHPIKGIRQIDGGPASPLVPFLSAYERHFMLGACAIIDCTAPYDWPFPPIESRFNNPLLYPKETQEKVLSRWQEYGFQKELKEGR